MSILETKEYQDLKRKQDSELESLLDKHNTRTQRKRLATKHVNQLKKLVYKWSKMEAKKQ